MSLDVTDLCILFVIFAIICYQLYDQQLLTYPTNTNNQDWILLAVLIVFNLWATFFISVNNFSLWTSSKSCILPCPSILKPLLSTRGNNYFLSKDGPTPENELRNCLLSSWGASHIFMYALITFIVPRLWWVVLISGIVWEIYESKELGCQDFLDIFWDSLGIFIGYTLAKKYKGNIEHFNSAISHEFEELHNIVKPPESESVKSESVKSESVKAESVKSESVKSESVKAESVDGSPHKIRPYNYVEPHSNVESRIVYDYERH
tara:strand:- start:209 stop:997 length:789 start_codon:yes stop_codon:yes gene_type:complete